LICLVPENSLQLVTFLLHKEGRQPANGKHHEIKAEHAVVEASSEESLKHINNLLKKGPGM